MHELDLRPRPNAELRRLREDELQGYRRDLSTSSERRRSTNMPEVAEAKSPRRSSTEDTKSP
jgi:hypothetical protein